MTDQKDPFPKIKADDLDTIITFLDDLRGSSSVGGSMVTSDDLGRWSRGAGGASGSTSSSWPRGVFSLGDNISFSNSFPPSKVFEGDERFIKASDPFTGLQIRDKI